MSYEIRADVLRRFVKGEKVVVKADGLMEGKGVFICESLEEVQCALDKIHAYFG